jgi:hypothetical protein
MVLKQYVAVATMVSAAVKSWCGYIRYILLRIYLYTRLREGSFTLRGGKIILRARSMDNCSAIRSIGDGSKEVVARTQTCRSG